MTQYPSIVCPRCHKESFNPGDIENGYCGFCHMFHEDMEEVTRLHQRIWHVLEDTLERRRFRLYHQHGVVITNGRMLKDVWARHLGDAFAKAERKCRELNSPGRRPLL